MAADAPSRLRIANEIADAIKTGKMLSTQIVVRQMTGDQAIVPVAEVRQYLESCVVHEATDNLFAGDGTVYGVKVDFKCDARKKWSTLIFKFVAGSLSEIQFHNQGVVFVPSPPPPAYPQRAK